MAHPKTYLSQALAATSAPPGPKPPKGGWFDVAQLSPVRTKDGEVATRADLDALLLLLEKGTNAKVDAALLGFDAGDLDRLGLELAQAWIRARGPGDATWAITGAARLGGRGTVRALALAVRKFAREKAVPAAILLVDAIGELESDAALIELRKLESAPKDVSAAATKHAARIRKRRGLTDEDVEDLIVPECSLGAGQALDFGPRQFQIDFDADFTPAVRDATGKRLANLPRCGKNDDAQKATAALELWTDLKSLLRDTLRGETKRLEWAMCAERRWSVERFVAAIVRHPLLVRLAQRLVWAIEEGGGEGGEGASGGDASLRLFRIAEDHTFADETDSPIELPAGASVLLPHPIALSQEVAAKWGTLMADYSILSPFPQLGRETYTPTEAERRSTVLERFRGMEVSAKSRFVLESYGWSEGDGYEGAGSFSLVLPDGTEAFAELGTRWEREGTTMVSVRASRKLGEMDAISFSELCRDVARLPRP